MRNYFTEAQRLGSIPESVKQRHKRKRKREVTVASDKYNYLVFFYNGNLAPLIENIFRNLKNISILRQTDILVACYKLQTLSTNHTRLRNLTSHKYKKTLVDKDRFLISSVLSIPVM